MNKTLLIGGVIASLFFLNKKPISKKTSKVSDTKPTDESESKGYEIVNCEKLIIHNAPKAYEYAYNVGMGVNEMTLQIEELLFGECLNISIEISKKIINTKEKAKFIFEMFKFAYSGYVVSHPEEMLNILNIIKNIKNANAELGFDTSEYTVELIRKNNDKGFKLVNCDSLIITNKVNFQSYLNYVMSEIFVNYSIIDTHHDSPYYFATFVLHNFSKDCYELFVNKQVNKNQLIISFMILGEAFEFYIKNRYEIDDKWKELFVSQEKYDKFMEDARQFYYEKYEPLFIKYDLTSEKIYELINELQKTGKFP